MNRSRRGRVSLPCVGNNMGRDDPAPTENYISLGARKVSSRPRNSILRESAA